jgi:hypothetical protein
VVTPAQRIGAAAAGGEAHVVHEDQIAVAVTRAGERPHRHEQRSTRTVEQVRRGITRGETCKTVAGQFPGQRRGRNRFHAASRAVAHRKQALVLRDLGEQLPHASLVASQQVILHRILDRRGHEVGADVEIAREPADREAVHQRDHRIRHQAEHDQERNDEAAGQSHVGLPIDGEDRAHGTRAWCAVEMDALHGTVPTAERCNAWVVSVAVDRCHA